MTKLLGVLQLAFLLTLSACEGTIDATETSDDESTPDRSVSPDHGDGTPGEELPVAPMRTVAFTESSEDLTNPERGFYVGYNLLDPSRAADVREDGHTLALSIVRLDAYRTRSLDATLLNALEDGFAAARAAGIKVILRFTYNSSFSADASKSRILGHLTQLSPLLHDNADVISVMQAGFIGAWGEWHSSTNGLDNDADRSTILNAILDALPSTRGVQVRTPMFKAAAFPGGALTSDEGHTTADKARIGHHNDCFLASNSDLGTFASPVATWQSYVATDGQYTAIGGETCAVFEARTNCAAAVEAMESQHWSYLNREYNQAVIAGWVADGCEPEIAQRLGYRFALEQVSYSETAAPGGIVELQVAVHNHGFATPFNPRPVEVVLGNGTTRQVIRLAGVDARRWTAGETTTFAARIQVPADAAPGSYTLSLRLPDSDDRLADDARFSIRLANAGVWDDASGANVLVSDLQVLAP